MTIKDMIDFHSLILTSGIGYQEDTPNLKAFGDCVQHYSTMCGCEAEAKESKRIECQRRYEDLIKNKIDEISAKILEYDSSYVFMSNNEVIRSI